MYSLRSQLGTSWNSTVGLITSAAYNLCVLTWFGYALMPASASKRVTGEFTYRPVFDRWNQAALALVTPGMASGPGHTYLTEIERTVDNIMAQSTQPSSNGHEDSKKQKIS
jgi:hypothetical protein